MIYPENTDKKENAEKVDKQKLVLDGTACLGYPEDEQAQVPRVKGLIELLNQYFGKNQEQR